MGYNTRQRECIIEYLKAIDGRFMSAYELEGLMSECVSRATLYRTLEKLVKEGIVNKMFDEKNNCFIYQYNQENNCAHHLHMKCYKCGKIIHLENIKIENANVELDFKHSLLGGVCGDCIGGGD